MGKWLFLSLTALATVGMVLSIMWMHQTMKLPPRDIEKIVGYDGSKLPEPQRQKVADGQAYGPVGFVVAFFCTVWAVFLAKTIDAFFP